MIAIAFIAYLVHLSGVLFAKTGYFLQKLSHMEKEKVQLDTSIDDSFCRL